MHYDGISVDVCYYGSQGKTKCHAFNSGVGMPRKITVPLRVTPESVQIAKKAAALKEMTLTDYASAALINVANHDIDEFAKAQVKASRKTKGEKPPEIEPK
jgi:hypothetical protein